MNTYNARHFLLAPSTPVPHYGAQGLRASLLVGSDDQQIVARFNNAFHTPISVARWSHDSSILLTGSVLAWRVDMGEMLLANRHAHSSMPIRGMSFSDRVDAVRCSFGLMASLFNRYRIRGPPLSSCSTTHLFPCYLF